MTFSLKNILLVIVAVVFGSLAFYTMTRPTLGASFPDPRTNVQMVASSTAWTLTSGASATRVVATSTTPGVRVALSFQTNNCGVGIVYLNFNDFAGATSTGYQVTASSTVVFADTLPMVYGSVRAFSSLAGCTLLVNEFRSPV